MTTTNKAAKVPRTCSRCGRLGHTVTTCEQRDGLISAVDKVGIEIEGMWDDLQEVKSRSRAEGLGDCSDGSIDETDGEAHEFQTIPGTPGEACSQLVRYYPDYTNNSCGMHVHVSFKDPIDVASLACKEFHDYFIERWTKWGKQKQIPQTHAFWSRLEGANTYCYRNKASEWARDVFSDASRYQQLNFTSWHEHKTVECRLLPMFRDASLAVSAVATLLDIYDQWIHHYWPSMLNMVSRRVAMVQLDLSQLHDIEVEIDLSGPPSDTLLASELEIPRIEPPQPGAVRTSRALLRYAGATLAPGLIVSG